MVNGVAHTALRVTEHLVRRGHRPLVVAPAAPPQYGRAKDEVCPVVRIPAVSWPGYPSVRLALPSREVSTAIIAHRPDVVHLSSPVLLGARAMTAARRRDLPTLAVYETDMAAYSNAYLRGLPGGPSVAWRRLRSVHAAADRTLALSTASKLSLEAQGIPRVHICPHGVDSVRFHPAHRDDELRRTLAPNGEVLVGYVGRLAPEKHVQLLRATCDLPGVRVVIVGDGPTGRQLRNALPSAVFLGRRTGADLASIYASLDVFAHTGPFETFGLTVQEAMASGLHLGGRRRRHPRPLRGDPENTKGPGSHLGQSPPGGPGGEAPPGGVWGLHPHKSTKGDPTSRFLRVWIAQIDRAPGRIRTCAPASGGRCSIP